MQSGYPHSPLEKERRDKECISAINWKREIMKAIHKYQNDPNRIDTAQYVKII